MYVWVSIGSQLRDSVTPASVMTYHYRYIEHGNAIWYLSQLMSLAPTLEKTIYTSVFGRGFIYARIYSKQARVDKKLSVRALGKQS